MTHTGCRRRRRRAAQWMEFCCLSGAQRPKDAAIQQQIKAAVGNDKDDDD
jgi:hypothetical protein